MVTFFLFLCSVLAALAGFIVFAAAKGAIHEASGLVLFLTSAVLFVGAALNSAAHRIIELLVRISDAGSEAKNNPATVKIADKPAQELAPEPPTPAQQAPASAVASSSWVDAAKAELRAEKS